MKFSPILKSLLVLAATSLLAACGGGSGSDSAYKPPAIKINATVTAGNAMPGQPVDIRVQVNNGDGSAIADGTIVNANVSPNSSGSIRYVPASGANSTDSSGPTSGGVANFRYNAGGSGNVTLTFSATGTAGTASTNATVAVSGTGDYRLQLAPVRTELPPNVDSVGPALGSPYMAEVVITVRDGNGQLVNKEDGVSVSLNPVDSTGGFSTLDDPETSDINEFLVRMGQAPVDVVAGKATVFVHSLRATGTTTLTVTFLDEVTNNTVTATQEFQIVSGTPQLPAQLVLVQKSGAVYVQGSGGNTSGLLQAEIRDSLGQPVPEPVVNGAAFNNYKLEIVGAAAGGPNLNGIDAAGNSVTGTSINLRTTAGIGSANIQAGTEVGSYVVRMTTDRADNNVDNGISDPITVERSVIISDGRLFDLEIMQPTTNALVINPADGNITSNTTQPTIPPAPDGSYSLAVSVLATDRLGNPVIPGTVIRFGLIDEPQVNGEGQFNLSGTDGDPQEGGTLFTSLSGQFRTAGGGAGAGDTLVVFAEDIEGNRDMESARIVERINSETSLTVDYRFNHNDTTGQSVNYGGVLPYVIGRAADGNIVTTSVATNEIGVAKTQMNYPVSKLGKRAIVWAQADGPMVAGQPKKVTDVEWAYFAGVADASLVVSPSVIPANTTQEVTICVYDALQAPIGGVPVRFQFEGITGSGTVDGVADTGLVQNATALGNGCTTATVVTRGMTRADGAKLVFTAAGASGEVTFTFSALVLTAVPSQMTSGGTVTLTLLNSSGVPQPGFQISGTCEGHDGAQISLSTPPGITNDSGVTTAVISATNLNQVNGAGRGSCTFSTADRSATATVTLTGRNLCDLPVSPLPPGCSGGGGGTTQYALVANMDPGAAIGSYTITSAPAGVVCTMAGGAAGGLCAQANFASGTEVILTTSGPGTFVGWSGECAALSTDPLQARVQMTGDRICRAIWQ